MLSPVLATRIDEAATMGVLSPNPFTGLAALARPIPSPSSDYVSPLGAALYPSIPPSPFNALLTPPPANPPVSLLGQWAAEALVRKRVFISFQMEDQWAVKHLRDVSAAPEIAFQFYDESVRDAFDSYSAPYIKQKLREKISRSSMTVCIVGQKTRDSRWVDFEIHESLKKGNRVIGMTAPGLTTVPYPRRFEQLGAPIKVWNLAWLKKEIDAAPEPDPFPWTS